MKQAKTILAALADRACSHQPKLTPFDDADWESYLDCQSHNPEVYYGGGPHYHPRRYVRVRRTPRIRRE